MPKVPGVGARVHALEEQVRILTAALEEARRAEKRQAAPFANRRVPVPKKPGRKSGEDYGKHARRMPPENLPVTEECVADLPPQCPHCNSTNLASFDAADEQFQTEIQCRTIRRRFVIHRGCCLDCGTPLEGRHPLQTSTATGAAREQLGAQAHALMSILNKQMGLSHGKVAWLFEKVFHLKINRSTSVRSVERTGRSCEPAYEQIGQDVRAAEQVTPDETGWRVGGYKAWLHAFATPRAPPTTTSIPHGASPPPNGCWGSIGRAGWCMTAGAFTISSAGRYQQCNTHLLHRCHELLEIAREAVQHVFPNLERPVAKGLALRDRYEQDTLSGLWAAAGRLTAQTRSLGMDISRIRVIVAWQNSWPGTRKKSWLTSGIRAWTPRTIKESNPSDPP